MSLPINPDKPLGDFIKAYIARSRDPAILSRRTGSGGAVTSILCYLLDKRICDAVIAARRTRGFEGEVIVARNRDELLKAAGNKWSIVPFTSKIKKIIEEEDLKNIAIIGLPCQVQFLGYMKMFPILESDFGERIKIVISLFCMGTFAHEVFLAYLRSNYNIRAEDIEDMRIVEEYLVITTKDREIKIKISEITPYLQTGCLLCTDYTGVLSDISAGVVNSIPKHTILLTRSELGNKIVEDAIRSGYIEAKEASTAIITEIKEKALEKIRRANYYATRLL